MKLMKDFDTFINKISDPLFPLVNKIMHLYKVSKNINVERTPLQILN